MPELHVRNLSPESHKRVRERAIADGRSMSAEAIAVLAQALQPISDSRARQRAAVERCGRSGGATAYPTDLPSAEQLVREDRELTR